MTRAFDFQSLRAAWFLVLLSNFGYCPRSVAADAVPPRFIVDDEAFEEGVIAASRKLLNQGRLLRVDQLQRQLNRQFSAVKFASSAVQKLAPPELYDRVRASTFAIGTVYECTNCSDWHFNSAAGFVLTEDGVLCTAYHVAAARDEEANPQIGSYVVAADSSGRVFPVKEVLAADVESDTCLLRLEASGLKPLALRAGARTGDRIFCLSHPDANYFLFSEGMVARVHWMHDVLGADEVESAGKRRPASSRPILCLNVTADFAPGSSGGPIVDEAGNVVALVQSIANFVDDDGKGASPLVVGPVRYCVAAEEILRLTQPHAVSKSKERKKKR